MRRKSTPEYDSQRQQNVLLEEINKQVKTVAEGHSGLDRKIDKTNERLDDIDDRLQIISNTLSDHSNKFAEHEQRFDRIEMVLTDTNARVKKVEQKVDIIASDHEHRIQKLEAVK